jgi:hypothetical protein
VDLGSLRRLADRQLGLLTRAQAVESGMSDARWRRLHRDGTLVAVNPKVSMLAGVRLTPALEIKAAVLAAPEGVMASHTSAAHLWGAHAAGTEPVHLLSLVRGRKFTLPPTSSICGPSCGRVCPPPTR